MEWRDPIYLIIGLCVSLIWLALVWWSVARNHRMRERFAPGAMRTRILSPDRSWPAWAAGVVQAVAILLAFASLAGPQFGETEQVVESRGNDLYVLLDVSRSMMATDVLPSRLDRAKADIASLVNRLKGERVGLIVFAGQAVIQCPLTVDYENYKRILASVDSFSAPRGGTAIGDAIRKSVEILSQAPTQKRSILLVSDGGDLESSPIEAADLAAENNIPIYAVGLGDSIEGARIPAGETGGFVEFGGEQVWSKLEPALLEDIARRSSGQFFEAGTRSMDMNEFHAKYLQGEGAGPVETRSEVVKAEQFQWFLGFAIALILLSKIQWSHRTSKVVGENALHQPFPAASVLWFVISLLSVPSVHALEERAALDPMDAFRQAYREHRSGNPEEAIDWYEQASRSPDPKLVAASQYNLGKLYLNQIPPEAISSAENVTVEQRPRVESLAALAIDSFTNSLELQPEKQEARNALEATKQWFAAAKRAWRLKDLRAKVEKAGGLMALQDVAKSQLELFQETQQPDIAVPPARYAELAQRQSSLLEELEMIRLQIRQELGNAAAPDPANPPQDQQRDLEIIDRIIAECRDAMEKGRLQFSEFALQDAGKELSSALQSLENSWNLLAPYEAVLDRALREQEELVNEFDSSDPLADNISNTIWAQRESWNRKRASLLAEKASQALAMPNPPEKEQGADSDRGSLKKAIEIGPRAADAMRAAMNHALTKDAASTKERADEALQLLRQLIPPQDPKQEQDSKSDSNQDQQQESKSEDPSSSEQKSSEKEDPSKNDESNNNEEKSEEKQESSGKDEPKAGPDQEEKSKEQSENKDTKESEAKEENNTKPRQEDGNTAESKESAAQADSASSGDKLLISPERLEELLRKVREREVEKRIRDKRWRERNYGRKPVEKDW